jgi:hypothetical protein
MISAEDIEAFREDAETFEAVNTRILKGVTRHREMTAEEVLPYVRHAMRLQGWLSMALDDLHRRNADAMSPGEPEYPVE